MTESTLFAAIVLGALWSVSQAAAWPELHGVLTGMEMHCKVCGASDSEDHAWLSSSEKQSCGVQVFFCFALITNLIVSALLVLGGSAVITAVTGMNVYAASMLIPISVLLYTASGGLKATFTTSYAHTVIIYVALCLFTFTVYAGSKDLSIGSIDRVSIHTCLSDGSSCHCFLQIGALPFHEHSHEKCAPLNSSAFCLLRVSLLSVSEGSVCWKNIKSTFHFRFSDVKACHLSSCTKEAICY